MKRKAEVFRVVLSGELLARMDAYRGMRKLQTGKVLQRATAVNELLEAALGAQPAADELPDCASLVRRVKRLEGMADDFQRQLDDTTREESWP